MKNAPTLEQFKQLFHYADKIKKLAPWEWMFESEIFGLSLPEYEENFYISILGNAGEHLAFSVLQGDLSLEVFDFITTNDIDTSNLFFYMKQLQISFEDREFCQKEDLEIIKKLGLKFRGQKAYPTFRAMHAGYLPYFIEKYEAQILLDILDQSLAVLERFHDDENLLYQEEGKIFFRVKTETGEWKDENREVPTIIDQPILSKIPRHLIDKIMEMPRREAVVEMDLSSAPAIVKDEEGRPYLPLAVLIADQQSGGILKMDLIEPARDAVDFLKTIPTKILEVIQTLEIIPTTFQMRYTYLIEPFESVFKQLGIELEIVDRLPNVEMIQRSMEKYFQSLR